MFPEGSVILIIAPIELLRIDVSAFLVLFEDFEKWLCAYLHFGKNPNSEPPLIGEVELSKYTILPIFPQLRASTYVPELLRILRQIRPDLNIPGAKDLNQGQILMK